MLRMQGRIREIAVELVVRDGRRLPVIANAAVKTDASGAPALIRLALFDATERRSYERELLAARRRAEESEERAVALARTLQASLLPPTIPQPAGLDVGAAYRPSGDGSTVGGDFYDVFETADDRVVIVLGDVAGKGVEAAVLTSLARHTVRTEAMRETSPARVLRTVADAFLRYHPEDYCTAVLAIVDAGLPRATMTIATAGHLLPLRWRAADGTVEKIGGAGDGGAGRLLGLLPDPDVSETVVARDPGDVFVVFTDGVVEARQGDEFFGDERLVAVLESAAASGSRLVSAQALADAVVTAVLGFQDGDARDDIAVVVWKARPQP